MAVSLAVTDLALLFMVIACLIWRHRVTGRWVWDAGPLQPAMTEDEHEERIYTSAKQLKALVYWASTVDIPNEHLETLAELSNRVEKLEDVRAAAARVAWETSENEPGSHDWRLINYLRIKVADLNDATYESKTQPESTALNSGDTAPKAGSGPSS